ncbi:MAG: hypothetical protein JWM11_1678 [Planctomycetaceae bacterium]|nr:hypothetical protein [Planctomycetaceae bacterium]
MVAPQEYASYNPSPKLIQPMRRQAIPANSQNPYAGNVQQAGMSTREQ